MKRRKVNFVENSKVEMDLAENNESTTTGEMSPRASETSRLVSQGSNTRPSYLNITSNVCALFVVALMLYCSFSSKLTLFSFHPIFMTIGWLLFMTSAINAITPGDLATEWMPVRLRSTRHWILQLCAATSVLIGFLIILINKFINDRPHFVSLHAKLGLASIILTCGASLGGAGALYSLQLKKYIAPIFIKLIHASAGLITFILGIVTIILGLYSSWFEAFGDFLKYIIFVLVLVIAVLTVLRPSLKIYFRIREKLGNTN